MLKNLSLKVRLVLSFSFVAFLLVAVGTVSYVTFEKILLYYGHVVDVNFPKVTELTNSRARQKDVVIAVASVIGGEVQKEKVDTQSKALESAVERYEVAMKKYAGLPFAEGEEALATNVENAWKPFLEMSRKFIQLSYSSKNEDHLLRDRTAETEYLVVRKTFIDSLAKLIEFQDSEAKKWSDDAKSVSAKAKNLLLTTVILGFLTTLVIGLLIARSLSKSLTHVAQRLSSSSTKVNFAAQEIASSSDELSASISEQSSSVQETSASTEQISSMVAKNAENAAQSATNAKQAKRHVTNGQEALNEVSKAINSISENIGHISTQTETHNREFSEIVKLIGEIESKTKVINEIVFQTKLLSFNASVEAARAGEHGKGFAVVAEEVGNLARMSGTAAKEISEMLTSSVQRVEEIVRHSNSEITMLLDTGKQQIAGGTKVVQRCESLFREIVNSVQDVDRMAEEISSASKEQAQGVQEITRAITQLSSANSQNAAASSRSSDAAGDLASQSESMTTLVSELVQIVNGANRPLSEPPAPADEEADQEAPPSPSHIRLAS